MGAPEGVDWWGTDKETIKEVREDIRKLIEVINKHPELKQLMQEPWTPLNKKDAKDYLDKEKSYPKIYTPTQVPTSAPTSAPPKKSSSSVLGLCVLALVTS